MRRVSLSRQRQKRRLTERYADSKGIPFDSYRDWLPSKVSDWPQVVRVQDDSVEQLMHEWFYAWCWGCNTTPAFNLPASRLETHHIIGGTKGRSDEFCQIAMLCSACHSKANTDELPLGRMLYLKWKWDRRHCDWVRLALLARRFLPELITDSP